MNNPNAGPALVFALFCMGLFLIVVLAIYIFFCLTLQRTQSEVHPRNRQIPPGLVWLHMLHLGGAIPLLGIVIGIAASVWDVVMVLKLSASLKAEFEDRGWSTAHEGFGRPVGLIWSVGQLAGLPVGLVLNLVGPQQLAGNRGLLLGIAGVMIAYGLTLLVCWILYWVQMAGYGRRLRERGGGYGYRPGSAEEDYDDEYRGPRHRRPEDDEDDFDRPVRRRPAVEDDEDDRPRRRRVDGYDDEEDDRPRRRRDEY